MFLVLDYLIQKYVTVAISWEVLSEPEYLKNADIPTLKMLEAYCVSWRAQEYFYL